MRVVSRGQIDPMQMRIILSHQFMTIIEILVQHSCWYTRV